MTFSDIRYVFGGYTNQVGVEWLFSDHLIALSSVMVVAVAFLWWKAKNLKDLRVIIALYILGFRGVIFTRDIFNSFVLIEILSLTSYIMVAKTCRKTAFDYLIIGTVGASFYLLGIFFLYNQTGYLNMQLSNGTNRLSSLFITLGLLIKIGAMPFGFFYRRVCENSDNYLAAIMSIGGKSLLVLAMHLQQNNILFFEPEFLKIFLILGAIVFSIQACFAKNNLQIMAMDNVAWSSLTFVVIITNNYQLAVATVFYSVIIKPLGFIINNINNKFYKLFITLYIAGVPPFPGFFIKLEMLQISLIFLPLVLTSLYYSFRITKNE